MKQTRKTVLIAGFIGNVVEWYDFALYGFFASLFSTIFFPEENGVANLLAVYGIFAAGFVMRPIGAVFFGWLGDRIGRSRTMIVSVALMVIPTAVLGLLPTYQQIGVIAPIALVVLRLFQGLSVGGEFSTSVVYLVETASKKKRGRSGSLANLGSITGTAVGSLAAMASLNLLPDEQAHAWGWRIPYFFGAVIGLVGLWLRRHLPRSPEFEKQEARRENEEPLRKIFLETLPKTVQAAVFAGGYGVAFYLAGVYYPNWISTHTEIGLDKAMVVNSISLLACLPFVYLMGWWSDVISRRYLMMGALAASGVAAVVAFQPSLQTGVWSIAISQFSLLLTLSVMLGSAPALLALLFPVRIRNTGYSISYALGMGIVGGSTPMIATWLIEKTSIASSPAYLLTACVLLAVVAVWKMRLVDERASSR